MQASDLPHQEKTHLCFVIPTIPRFFLIIKVPAKKKNKNIPHREDKS